MTLFILRKKKNNAIISIYSKKGKLVKNRKRRKIWKIKIKTILIIIQ